GSGSTGRVTIRAMEHGVAPARRQLFGVRRCPAGSGVPAGRKSARYERIRLPAQSGISLVEVSIALEASCYEASDSPHRASANLRVPGQQHHVVVVPDEFGAGWN